MAVSLSPLNHPLVCAGGVDLTSSDSFDGMSGIALDDNLQANQGDRRGVLSGYQTVAPTLLLRENTKTSFR